MVFGITRCLFCPHHKTRLDKIRQDETRTHTWPTFVLLMLQELMEEYEELREEHYAGQEERHYLTFEKAKDKRKAIDFQKRPPAPAPLKPGITVVTGTYALDDVLDYIDWNPFFQASYRPSVGRFPSCCCRPSASSFFSC